MIIDKISHLNLDILYKGLIDKQKDPKLRNAPFGRNFARLLNHMSITIELSEITDTEYFFLKMFCSTVSPRFKKYESEQHKMNIKFLANNYTDMTSVIRDTKNLCSYIEEYEDDYSFYNYLLPTGVHTSSCSVIFRGSQLMNLISLEPAIFFIGGSAGKCKLKSDNNELLLDPNYEFEKDADFSNYLIKTFISKFYKFMQERFMYNDIVSDKINSTFFISNDTYDLKIHSINNPLMVIDWVNDSIEDMTDKFSYFKQSRSELTNVQKYEYEEPFYTLKSTTFDIKLSLPFASIITMIEILPYDRITSMDSLMLLQYKSRDTNFTPNSIITNITNNKINIIGINNLITNLNSYNLEDIKSMELIMGYVPLTLTLSISMYDIDEFIEPFIKNIEDRKKMFRIPYEQEILLNIFNKLKLIVKSVYNKMV